MNALVGHVLFSLLHAFLLQEGGAPRTVDPARAGRGSSRAELQVRVVSRAGRTALQGIDVHLLPLTGVWRSRSSGTAEGTLRRFPTTDADGRVRFRAPAGQYRLTFGWESGGARGEEVHLTTAEVRALEVELDLGSTQLYFGRVQRAGGVPLAGADVLLFRPWSWSNEALPYQDPRVQRELQSTTSDPEGLFVLRVPAGERLYLRVAAPGLATVFVSVDDAHGDESRAFPVLMEPRAELRVTVLEGDQPVQGARATLFRGTQFLASRETDDAGEARLENLVACQDLELRVGRPEPPEVHATVGRDPSLELYRDPRRVSLTLAAGESRALTFVLSPRCRLEGTVRDASGEPIAGLSLRIGRAWEGHESDAGPRPLHWASAFGSAGTRTDEQGRYAFEHLSPGTWWIGPAPRNHVRNSPANESTPAFVWPVVIPEDVGSTRTFDFRVTRGLYLRGRVVRPEGGGIVARIEIVDGPVAKSDEDGRFELGPLEPGTYELRASATGYRLPGTLRARAGAQDVVLELVPREPGPGR